MTTEAIKISYEFLYGEHSKLSYDIDIDPSQKSQKLPDSPPKHEWMALSFKQCPNCPLDITKVKTCPAAVKIEEIVGDFAEIISHESVEVIVKTPKRTISGKTSTQKALSSLMGLFLANSDCPHMQFFRPMAYFHLPLSSPEETMIRAMTTYFLARYYKHQQNEIFDLKLLYSVYKNMQTVNEHLAKRLQTCTNGDAAKNAVVILHLMSCVLPMSLEESLEQIKPLFQGLLDNNQ